MRLNELRKKFSGHYATVFSDELIVPWKPLSLSDYLKYANEVHPQLGLPPNLEDEVFCRCVLDPYFVRQIDFLLAGIVSVVVQCVLQYSGPTGPDSFNQDIENTRSNIVGGNLAVLHDMVDMVTWAFPYTPDQIYAMDYKTFLERLVLAEKKLLRLGMIKEPFTVVAKQDKKPRARPTVDAKRLFEEQQKNKQFKQPRQPVAPPPTSTKDLEGLEGQGKWWKNSPVLEAPHKEKIDFKTEQKEHDVFATTGWDKVDLEIDRAKMIQDAQVIYAPVLKKLAEQKLKKKKKE